MPTFCPRRAPACTLDGMMDPRLFLATAPACTLDGMMDPRLFLATAPPVRWLRHTAPRCTPLSRHNERDTTQRTPSRTRGEGAGSTRRRNGACRAPNEWRSYRVWEPQGALHEHLCGISGPQSRAPPLPEYPHSTNPRTLTHVDGLNLDASASPAPQESAPGCFSDSSWGINHNC